jgi:ankyrin repeat protein
LKLFQLTGRIPLHLAAMKGRVAVIRELLQAKPESIYEKLGRGETVLHLCVKYNRLEALETLLQYLRSCNDMEFLLNSGDDDGNTILHLAVALKQMEASTLVYTLYIRRVTLTVTDITNTCSSWTKRKTERVEENDFHFSPIF